MLSTNVQSMQKNNVNDDDDVPQGINLPISNYFEFLIIEEHWKDVAVKNQLVSIKLMSFISLITFNISNSDFCFGNQWRDQYRDHN